MAHPGRSFRGGKRGGKRVRTKIDATQVAAVSDVCSTAGRSGQRPVASTTTSPMLQSRQTAVHVAVRGQGGRHRRHRPCGQTARLLLLPHRANRPGTLIGRTYLIRRPSALISGSSSPPTLALLASLAVFPVRCLDAAVHFVYYTQVYIRSLTTHSALPDRTQSGSSRAPTPLTAGCHAHGHAWAC
jgi:hypothetical protein